VIARPIHLNPYEFVVVASLRAQQLLAGCSPRLAGDHSPATMAQMEVAEGLVRNLSVGDGPGESAERVEGSQLPNANLGVGSLGVGS
jgi:DNA-directed RNA polymerase subunit K/omega